jgi:hypothetical protein
MNVPANDQPRPEKRGIETGAGLGIDQEIKVSRKENLLRSWMKHGMAILRSAVVT